jgi:ABC-2 type transport system permease protein
MSAAADPAPVRFPWTRLYAWSVRRELWENRQVYLAPLAIAGVGLLGVLLSTFNLQHRLQILHGDAASKAGRTAAMGVIGPYAFIAGAIMLTGLFVSFFYCLGALHGERRDRSILFWKSLPVSDIVTVLAKFTVPFVIVPAATFAMIVATQLVAFVFELLVVVVQGSDPAAYWPYADLRLMWVSLAVGLPYMALWHAPLMAWLLLVSAWAKRTPILWAIVPPAAPAILEPLAFGTHHVWDFIANRLLGAGVVFTAHAQGKLPVQRFDQLEIARPLLFPGLWGGLVFAALFLAAAVWLRRRREPV